MMKHKGDGHLVTIDTVVKCVAAGGSLKASAAAQGAVPLDEIDYSAGFGGNGLAKRLLAGSTASAPKRLKATQNTADDEDED
eukprot:345930-Prymnesium_polylepis.1